jgi:hypothetical protein
MTGFRKRIDEAGFEFILGLTLSAVSATKTFAKSSLNIVNVDTTVQDKAVTFATDARLLHKARIGKTAFVRSQRYALARQINRTLPRTESCAPTWAGTSAALTARDLAMSQRHRV